MKRAPNQHKSQAAVSNLDEIQEIDPRGRPSRVGAMVLASLGGACIVFAAIALVRTAPRSVTPAPDPLGDLVARAHPAGAAADPPRDTIGQDVTFPRTLSDSDNPTTALEAVRDARAAVPGDLAPGAPTAPPAAADRLPVVPLPAQTVLQATAAGSSPPDALTTMARHVAREEIGGDEAEVGTAGGYQLQVSSFKKTEEAEGFAAVLRRRGHKAYVEAANVKGRGLWYRVRIGPFKYRRSAVIYRQDFEAKERMVTFIIDPPKTDVRLATKAGDE